MEFLEPIKIAGVVVLFKPTIEVLDNIDTYVGALEKLIVVDNTPIKEIDSDVICKINSIPKVDYVSLQENMGIAYALNVACNKAETFDYLLTMDQDSKFIKGAIYDFIAKVKEYGINSNVAIFSANNDGSIVKNKPDMRNRVITSGNIIDLRKIRQIGDFVEKLFIDEVDHELCYRAKKHNFDVVMFTDVLMEHNLGVDLYYTFLGKKLKFSSHNPLRLYYITRNSLYIAKEYPGMLLYYAMTLSKLLIKAIVFEHDKINRLRYMYCGVYDFIQSRYGAYDDNWKMG